ncbi:Transcription factor gsfR2 [Paramyrothecium foliicola]|nr:Transcription factor gsfR2 [Paramyrothecium foliicola]
MTLTTDISLALAQKRPACVACGKAKRKCSKELPACARCRVKKARCAYPMAPILVTPADHGFMTDTNQSAARTPTVHDDSSVNQESPSPYTGPAAAVQIPEAAFVETPWFLAQSSWEIDHIRIEEDNHITYPDSGLDFFFDQMTSWLDQWTKENHCAFIHARLYGTDLPNPLQYAFATWQTYRSATTKTSKRIALTMASSWAKNLIQEHSMYDSLAASPLDLVSHLGRTQALLVFQFIGLFDGDVRARAEAETISPTLIKWADSLLEAATTNVAVARSFDPEDDLGHAHPSHLSSSGSLASTWKAWILSESIRRTWITATLTEAAFLILKQGFSICPGSIAFNGRQGLWDASSPHAWLASVQKPSSAKVPVSCRGLVLLFREAVPSDVDEFAQALLAYGSGRERFEDWLASGM